MVSAEKVLFKRFVLEKMLITEPRKALQLIVVPSTDFLSQHNSSNEFRYIMEASTIHDFTIVEQK